MLSRQSLSGERQLVEAAGIEAVPAVLYLSHFGRTRAGSYTHIYTQAGCAGRSAEMYS